jgi:hypothetical protein
MADQHVAVNEASVANLSNLGPKFDPAAGPVRLRAGESEKNFDGSPHDLAGPKTAIRLLQKWKEDT